MPKSYLVSKGSTDGELCFFLSMVVWGTDGEGWKKKYWKVFPPYYFCIFGMHNFNHKID